MNRNKARRHEPHPERSPVWLKYTSMLYPSLRLLVGLFGIIAIATLVYTAVRVNGTLVDAAIEIAQIGKTAHQGSASAAGGPPVPLVAADFLTIVIICLSAIALLVSFLGVVMGYGLKAVKIQLEADVKAQVQNDFEEWVRSYGKAGAEAARGAAFIDLAAVEWQLVKRKSYDKREIRFAALRGYRYAMHAVTRFDYAHELLQALPSGGERNELLVSVKEKLLYAYNTQAYYLAYIYYHGWLAETAESEATLTDTALRLSNWCYREIARGWENYSLEIQRRWAHYCDTRIFALMTCGRMRDHAVEAQGLRERLRTHVASLDADDMRTWLNNKEWDYSAIESRRPLTGRY